MISVYRLETEILITFDISICLHVFSFVSATQMERENSQFGRKQSVSLFLEFIHRNASSKNKFPGKEREGGEKGKQQLFFLSIQNE